jgi:hypothetical protein
MSGSGRSEDGDEVLYSHPNVFGNLPQEERRYISPAVVGHRGLAPIAMPELAVRTFLTNQIKPEVPQDSHDLIWLENGNAAAHGRSSNSDCLSADKFRF